MENSFTIIENGDSLDINNTERDVLLSIDAIYQCSDCGNSFYHISDSHSFGEICGLLTINKTEMGIIDRERDGITCTESESAIIKYWIKDTLLAVHDGSTKIERLIQDYLPNEYGEAIDEMEEK